MGTVSKELRKVRRKADPRTGVVREVLLAEMHECALEVCLSERVNHPKGVTTHPSDASAPRPH